MNTLHDTTDSPLPRNERQRQAWRNAVARRRLEKMREEKDLHRFLVDVWDEPGNPSTPGT